MIPLTFDMLLKYGSITCALLSTIIYLSFRFLSRKKFDYIDIFTVGTAGSSLPSGGLLIYGAFDPTIIQKISDSNVYIAFAGIALLYVGLGTVKQKIKE
jgi:hypothetical protein